MGKVAPEVLDHVDDVIEAGSCDFVHDLADRDVPWEEGERYARFWPGARLLSVNGLGHHKIVNDPDVIAAGAAFLRGEVIGERVVSTQELVYGCA